MGSGPRGISLKDSLKLSCYSQTFMGESAFPGDLFLFQWDRRGKKISIYGSLWKSVIKVLVQLRRLCYWLICVPKADLLECKFPVPQTVTLFGNRICTEVSKFKWGYKDGPYLIQYGWGPYKRGQFGPRETCRGWRPCKQRTGVLWTQAQNTKDCSSHQRLGRGREGFPSGIQRDHGPTNAWMLGFWPPELWDNKFLVSLATWFVVLCFGSPSRPPQPRPGSQFPRWWRFLTGSTAWPQNIFLSTVSHP